MILITGVTMPLVPWHACTIFRGREYRLFGPIFQQNGQTLRGQLLTMLNSFNGTFHTSSAAFP